MMELATATSDCYDEVLLGDPADLYCLFYDDLVQNVIAWLST